MNIFTRTLFIAICCMATYCAAAQAPQQTQLPEVKHFPNPAGSSNVVNIVFTLPTNSYVSLKVFNPLGILMREVINGNLVAGDHSIPLDISNINEGVYFYTLSVNDRSETKKLTIKK